MGCDVVSFCAVFVCLAVAGSAVNINGGLDFPEPEPNNEPSSKGTYLEIEVQPPAVVARVWTAHARPDTMIKGITGANNTSYVILLSNPTTDVDIETNDIPSVKNKSQVLRKLIPNYDFPVVPVVTGKTPVTTESSPRRGWWPIGGRAGVRGSPPYLQIPLIPCRHQPLHANRPRQPVGWTWRALVGGGRTRLFGLSDKLGPLSEEKGDGIDGKLGGVIEDETLE